MDAVVIYKMITKIALMVNVKVMVEMKNLSLVEED